MLVTVDTTRAGPVGGTIDTPRHRALASAARVVILHLVRRAPHGLTAAEVAEATGRHLSTVREHLDQLTEAGLLVRQRRSDGTPGRPAWRYRAVSAPDAAAPGLYRELAGALVEHLVRTEDDPWAAGMAAGRAWGRKLIAASGPPRGRPGQRLIAVLDRLGFVPRVAEHDGADPAVIHLHACPFLDLVDSNADLVCGLHLGVLRGALGAAGAPGTEVALQPFGAPNACVVQLGARASDRDPDTSGEQR